MEKSSERERTMKKLKTTVKSCNEDNNQSKIVSSSNEEEWMKPEARIEE